MTDVVLLPVSVLPELVAAGEGQAPSVGLVEVLEAALTEE